MHNYTIYNVLNCTDILVFDFVIKTAFIKVKAIVA